MPPKASRIWQELNLERAERRHPHALAAGLNREWVRVRARISICREPQEWVLAQFGFQAAGGTTRGMYPTSPALRSSMLVNASTRDPVYRGQEQLIERGA